MANSIVKDIMIFLFIALFGLPLKGQLSFKEVIEESKGMKVPAISEKLIGNKFFEFDDITYQGKPVNNDSLQGKITVVNLWFIGCPPCIAEMKGLNEIVSKFESQNDLRFISFALDDKKSLETEFFPKRAFKFEIIPNSMKLLILDIQSPFGYPTTFVLDKSGLIRKIVTGSSTDVEVASKEIKEKLVPIIEELLLEK